MAQAIGKKTPELRILRVLSSQTAWNPPAVNPTWIAPEDVLRPGTGHFQNPVGYPFDDREIPR